MEYMLWAADGWLPSVEQIAVYFVKNDSRMKLLQNPKDLDKETHIAISKILRRKNSGPHRTFYSIIIPL